MAKKIVTENLFNMAKTLIKGGAKGKACSEYVGVSEHTISIIKNSVDFEDYKRRTAVKKQTNVAQQATQENVAKQATMGETQAVESKQMIIVQASHYMLEEQKKTNELLTLISNKLAFIVEELVGVKTGT